MIGEVVLVSMMLSRTNGSVYIIIPPLVAYNMGPLVDYVLEPVPSGVGSNISTTFDYGVGTGKIGFPVTSI